MLEPTRKLDRAQVRILAEKFADERHQFMAAGGNVNQKILDQQDRLDEFTSSMTPDETLAFFKMYTEETNAITQRTRDLIDEINRKAGRVSGPTRTMDRAAVRALVERSAEEQRQVAEAGGNVHQKALDQQDRLDKLAASMTTEEAIAFFNMHTEETQAATKRTLELVDELNRKTDDLNRKTLMLNQAQHDSAPNLLKTLAYGLLVLTLLPIVLGRVGGAELTALGLFFLSAFLILLLIDLFKWITARAGHSIRTKRAEQVRFSPEWKKAQAQRRRL